jgi:hypothetical protein
MRLAATHMPLAARLSDDSKQPKPAVAAIHMVPIPMTAATPLGVASRATIKVELLSISDRLNNTTTRQQKPLEAHSYAAKLDSSQDTFHTITLDR